MRLKKERVDFLSKNIVNTLIDEGFIIYPGGIKEKLYEMISARITEELMIEDKINEEVKELMKEHYNIIDAANADYGRMFKMIKSKLVKQKGVIL